MPSLERQLNSQVHGYSFHAGDAILRLSKGGGLEFRLANVSLADENNQEIAKAPYAAIGIAELSLLTFSPAASEIHLLEPKVLIHNIPGKGLTLNTTPVPPAAGWTPVPGTEQGNMASMGETPYADLTGAGGNGQAASARQLVQQASQQAAQPFNPAAMLSRLFKALHNRGGASSSLSRLGIQNAVIYFASEKGVSTWRVADFHVDLDESSEESGLVGAITLQHEDAAWSASFRAVNQPQDKRYLLTASMNDIVPRTIWRSFPALDPLKVAGFPVSGVARFDIGYDGELLGGEGEIKLGSGQFFAPFDEKHPASIDGGILKVSYDKANRALSIRPFEVHWEGSVLTLSGTVAQRTYAGAGQAVWTAELDGRGTVLSAPQFGVAPVALDAFKLSAIYETATDTLTVRDFTVRGAGGGFALSGQASAISSGGQLAVSGTVAPMPISFIKVIWPAFVANGARDWVGTNIPAGRITGGSFSVNASSADLTALDKDGDIPDSAASVRMSFSGLQIYHIKGLPPIVTKDSAFRVAGRRFLFEIAGEAHTDMPSGRQISFTNGQLAIDDLRPHFPDAEVRFRGGGELGAVLELLDQPPLGYVKAVGFKPNLVNGQVSGTFKIGFPLLNDLKFKQMNIMTKASVTGLKSSGLPGGLQVTGGTVSFDASENAISANGEVKVNNVAAQLQWQRIYDAPAERQPPLRVNAILGDKARDELGLNINHIVKGDMPVSMSVVMQKDGPPKVFMEANLTNADIFLTAIGWRKPPGQKTSVSFDVTQHPDNSLLLDNFKMTGDGLNIAGNLEFNGNRRIAAFEFPEFSTNSLSKLAISGELTPQNVLKVQAKGPSFDGRQFFRTLLSGGKIADNAPAPLKDEPGLDLNVEIETVFGYYDTTVKSVVIDAKRRGGKLTYLEASARLNGQMPMNVHVSQKPGQPRIFVCDAPDAAPCCG